MLNNQSMVYTFTPFVYGMVQFVAQSDTTLALYLEQEEVDCISLKGQGLRQAGCYAFDRLVLSGKATNVTTVPCLPPFGWHHLNKAPYPVARSLWGTRFGWLQHQQKVEPIWFSLLNNPSPLLEELALLVLCIDEYVALVPASLKQYEEVLVQKFWQFCLLIDQNKEAEQQALTFWVLKAFNFLFDCLENPLRGQSRSLYYKKETVLCYPTTALGCAYLLLAEADVDKHAFYFLQEHYLLDTRLENSCFIGWALHIIGRNDLLQDFLKHSDTNNNKASLYWQGIKSLQAQMQA